MPKFKVNIYRAQAYIVDASDAEQAVNRALGDDEADGLILQEEPMETTSHDVEEV